MILHIFLSTIWYLFAIVLPSIGAVAAQVTRALPQVRVSRGSAHRTAPPQESSAMSILRPDSLAMQSATMDRLIQARAMETLTVPW